MTPHDQPYPYSPSWSSSNVDNVDPRLYAANLSSSELAGALTLPPTPPPRDPPEMQLLSEHYAMDLNESYNQSPSSSRSPASVPTTGEISTKSIEEAAAQLGDPSLPHRYCSIKGCKAVIPGNSFFKMCEPCRNRYRSYGTTKRAKWRKEKEVVVAELQKLREDEDKRRAENGLPVRSFRRCSLDRVLSQFDSSHYLKATRSGRNTFSNSHRCVFHGHLSLK